MIVLGIETSCDETSAAVVCDGRRVLSSVVSSQIELHRAHGGVVPELAARSHVTAIIPVVEQALRDAGIERDDLDAIAVTQGPGLAGALVVGMNAAKAMAYALGRPLVAVNHLEAHIYANWLGEAGEEAPEPTFPVICLLVSGGHTELILMTGPRPLSAPGAHAGRCGGRGVRQGSAPAGSRISRRSRHPGSRAWRVIPTRSPCPAPGCRDRTTSASPA